MKTQDQLLKEFEAIASTVDYEKELFIFKKFVETIYPQIKNVNYKRRLEDIVQLGLIHITNFTEADKKGEYKGTRGKRGISSFTEETDKFLLEELKLIYSIPFNSYYSLGLHKTYKTYKPYEDWENTFVSGFSSIEEMRSHEKICIGKNKNFLKNHRASKENTVYLGLVAIDLDAKTEDELGIMKDKVNKIEELLNINSLRINTSKKGQQRLYLLDNLYTDLTLQEQFNNAFYEAGIDVDLKIKDASRLLRLPVGIHTKAFSSQEKHQELFKTEWENIDEVYIKSNPYSLIKKLKSLKVRDLDNIKSTIKTIKAKEIEEKEYDFNQLKETVISNKLSDKELIEIYNCIDINEIPDPIKLMLSYIPEGFRNLGLRAVHHYLTYEYPQERSDTQKKYILRKLAERLGGGELIYQANYVVDNKQYVKLSKENDLKQLYGVYTFQNKITKSDYVIINNMLIDSLKILKGGSFEAFLRILVNEAVNGIQEEYNKTQLLEVTNTSKRTLERYIKDFTKANLLIKKKAKNKKIGENTSYYVNPKCREIAVGYEKIRPVHIERDMKDLQTSELQLYYYLLFKIGKNEDFNKSQKKMAEDLNLDQSSITKLTNKLHDKNYLMKQTSGSGFYRVSNYIIK